MAVYYNDSDPAACAWLRELIAAGQLSNAVNVHAIDTATGHLTLCHEHAVGRNPNWVEAIALP